MIKCIYISIHLFICIFVYVLGSIDVLTLGSLCYSRRARLDLLLFSKWRRKDHFLFAILFYNFIYKNILNLKQFPVKMDFRPSKSCCLSSIVFLFVLLSLEFAFCVHLPYIKTTFNESVIGNVSKDNDNLWMYEYTRREGNVSMLLL